MPERQKSQKKPTKKERREGFVIFLILLSVSLFFFIMGKIVYGLLVLFIVILPIVGAYHKQIGEIISSMLGKRPHRIRVETLEQLKSSSPQEFELAMAMLLENMGYRKVRVTGGIGDLSRDITCENLTGHSVTVQCKRYGEQKISSPEIQKFIGMKTVEHKTDKGIFITTSSFTEPAKELANKHDIELWDGDKLADLLVKQMKARA